MFNPLDLFRSIGVLDLRLLNFADFLLVLHVFMVSEILHVLVMPVQSVLLLQTTPLIQIVFVLQTF